MAEHPDRSDCPPDEVLTALASGHLDGAAPWLEHIDTCAQCRARFEHLVTADSQVTKPQSSFPPIPLVRALGRALSAVEEEVRQFLRPAKLPDELGRLGPYRVLGVLGAGGMGVVLLADEPALNRRVALKVVRPHLASDHQARQRFQREARAMAAIEHDHVVPIFRIDEDAGVPFLAMPLLNGGTLSDALTRESRLAPAAAVEIGRQIAEGLSAAHARGLIHRDLKPGNIWLEPRREGEVRVRLLDFGLARAVTGDSELSTSGGIAGTPHYMSPEQARGQQLDERSDLFSLGIVLYRAVSGLAPFRGEDQLAVLHLIVTSTPTSVKLLVPEVPARLSELIDRLLEKNPADRPRSARVVADELAALAHAPQSVRVEADERAGVSPPDSPAETPQTAPRKHRWYRLTALVAAFAIAMVPHQAIEHAGAARSAVEPRGLWRFDPMRIPAGEGLPGRPNELVAVIGSGQRRHWGTVRGLAVAGSGSLVVSDGSGDGIRFWDPRSLQPVGALSTRSDFSRPFAVTPKGDRLVLTSAEGLEVWDIADPVKPRRVGAPVQPEQQISRLALAPDGGRLYTADQTEAGAIRCYSLTATELKPTESLPEHIGEPWSLAVSPDGRWVGAAGKSGAVTLWDTHDKNRAHVLQKKRTAGGRAHYLTFSPDSSKCYVVAEGAGSEVYQLTGARPSSPVAFETADDRPLGVFVGGGSRLIRVGEHSLAVWDATRDKPSQVGEGKMPVTVRAVAYAPQLGRLFTGHDDGGVRAWDVGSDKAISEINPLPYSELVRAALSPDGRWLATHHTGLAGKSTLELLDLTGTEPRTVPLPPPPDGLTFGHPAFTPDSSALLALGAATATLARWDLATGTPVGPRIVGNRAESITGSRFQLVPASDGSSAVGYDLVGSAHRFYQSDPPPVRDVSMPAGVEGLGVVDAISRPDGAVALATAGERAYLIEWDRQGQNSKATPLKDRSAQRLGVDADGVFVLGFRAGTLLEQRKDGPETRTVLSFPKSHGPGQVVAVSADGKWVAAATTSGHLVVADRRSGAVRWEIRLPGAPTELAFTHNGDGLMSANPDGTVFLLANGKRQP